ncbi:MAG: FimB/Mfa2 family fimbrial subunit [Parabacteroides gordonii]|nr:FimB/Mfa2 family fimbrial subunit [Parabacteroides gordonii]
MKKEELMDKITIHTDKAANRTDKPFIPIIRFAERRKLLTFVSVLLLLTGCVKDDLYNTPHPDKGAVMVTTDWTGRSSDSVVPGSYILRIGTEEQTVSKETNVFDALFLPGIQDLLVYNPTEGITIDENTATVNTLPDGTLEPMPGYLFSAARRLEIEKDDTLKVTVPMQQHIRSLTLTLKLKAGDEQRIRSTAATLTGIASAVDLTTGAITATEGKTVIPAFVPGTDDGGMRAAGQTYTAGRTRATGQPQLSATMRLLGVIAGEKQVLTLKITLTTGHVQTVTTDLTEALKNFGGSMKPLELDATLELAVEAGFTGTISDWNVVDNGQVDIH